MPPAPRNRPALDRALPADSGTFTDYRGDRTGWWFKFGDGGWHWVTVRGWWTDRQGRRVVQVEWSVDGGTWSDAFLVQADKIRAFEDEPEG